MLEVAGVGYSYGPRPVLDTISLSLDQGEILGLVGRNGVGKTTFLKLCCGLLRTRRGTIRVDGADPTTRAGRASIGYLPEEPGLYGEMRVAEYLRSMARLSGVPRREAKERVEEAIGLAGLEEMPRRLVGRLSHGYRRRVALAQALVGRPGLLLLDEPTTGMDPVQIRAFHDTLRRLAERAAVVLSSHNLYHVEEVCGSVAVLEGGRLFAHGTVREVRAQLAGRDRRIVVRVRGDERAAVDECRRAGVKVAGELRPDGVVRLELSGKTAEVDPADVVRRLVGAGLDVVGVEEVEAALESVYLSSITDRKG